MTRWLLCARAPKREREINDVSGQHGGIAKSDTEPAQTILVKSFSNLGAMKGCLFTDDGQKQSSGQPDESRNRGDSDSPSSGVRSERCVGRLRKHRGRACESCTPLDWGSPNTQDSGGAWLS